MDLVCKGKLCGEELIGWRGTAWAEREASRRGRGKAGVRGQSGVEENVCAEVGRARDKGASVGGASKESPGTRDRRTLGILHKSSPSFTTALISSVLSSPAWR